MHLIAIHNQANDASLQGFEVSCGSLAPDFHRLELNYTLRMGMRLF